jgi:hypothetical protein
VELDDSEVDPLEVDIELDDIVDVELAVLDEAELVVRVEIAELEVVMRTRLDELVDEPRLDVEEVDAIEEEDEDTTAGQTSKSIFIMLFVLSISLR